MTTIRSIVQARQPIVAARQPIEASEKFDCDQKQLTEGVAAKAAPGQALQSNFYFNFTRSRHNWIMENIFLFNAPIRKETIMLNGSLIGG